MPSPRSKRARLALLVASSLAGLVVVAWLALPYLVAGWLQQTLAAHGFDKVRVDPGYPGPRAWRIHRLTLGGTAAGQAFVLDARDLELEYTLAMLASGHIRRLHIPAAELRLAPAAPVAAIPMQPFTLPLPGTWVAALPLQELVIGQLQVHTPQDQAGTPTYLLQARAQRSGAALQSRWSLTRTAQPWFELELNVIEDGSLAVLLYRPPSKDRPVLQVDAMLSPYEADRLTVRAALNAEFKPLAALLAPWLSLPKAILPVEGRLQLRWHGEIPAVFPATSAKSAAGPALHSTVSMDLNATRIGYILQDGRVHAEADLTAGNHTLQWRLDKSTRLSAYLSPALLALTAGVDRSQFVRTAVPLVIRTPRGLSGQLVLTPEKIDLEIAPTATLVAEQLKTPDATIRTLRLTLPGATRVSCRTGSDHCETAGFEVTVTAPTIQPQFAELGNLENLAIAARIGAGRLDHMPPLTFRAASVNLLGGRVHGRDLRYDPTRETNLLRLELEQIDLARLVSLERQEIEATGRLHGHLPIELGARGIRVADGRLQAAAPGGVIRYRPSESVRATAEANPNLQLVLDALGNYRYDSLDIGLDYAENGDLAARLAVTGHNPDWSSGRPINLNITVSENIPTLLRSLRLAGEVESEVEKRTRERPAPRP
jgi:hypothetical protein